MSIEVTSSPTTVTSGVVVSTTTSSTELCTQDSPTTVEGVKKEYSIVGDGIYASVSADEAPQWLLSIIDSVVAVPLANGKLDLVEARTSILAALDSIEVAKNQYQELVNISATIDSVLASKLATLNASVEGNSATILDMRSTYTTKDSAAAIAADKLEASLSSLEAGNIGSEIARIDTAVAETNTTYATSIDALESVLESQGAGLTASSNAITTLNTYVGVGPSGATGTGLLSDIYVLQKQNDGIIETTTGTYDVILNPLDINTSELITTAEPYASWIAADTAAGGIDTRLAKIGDVYIKYTDATDGTKAYVASYKFIRTVVDETSPYATDTEGFTWALVTDQAAQDAYTQAINAYELADGKITTTMSDTPPLNPSVGDFWINSGDLNRLTRWDGTSWVDVQDGNIAANAQAITDLDVKVNDPTTGTLATAINDLSTSVSAEIKDGLTTVESKFEYNSTLKLNSSYYSSGFGLVATGTSGAGTETSPFSSEFWVNAEKFRFTNSNATLVDSPFSIDTSTAVPKVTFNGLVTFGSGQTGTVQDAIANTTIDGGMIKTGTIDANDIRTGTLELNGLTTFVPPPGYSGTICDSEGVKVYNDGILRVKMGRL